MRENKNILLAEDDENLGKLLISYLKAKGFHVELAKNGNCLLYTSDAADD